MDAWLNKRMAGMKLNGGLVNNLCSVDDIGLLAMYRTDLKDTIMSAVDRS